MIGVMWAKGSRPLNGKRVHLMRKREIVMNVVRVSSPVDSVLFFLPPRGSPGTSVCLSNLGRMLRLWVKEEKEEEGGRRRLLEWGRGG